MGKGRIQGTPIIVDNFRWAPLPTDDAVQYIYFLTHMHMDHTEGLKQTWDAGPLYCSPVTAALVQRKYGVKPAVLQPLELDVPHRIPLDPSGSVMATVTLLDANHCPGAVMLLIQGYFGTILHTGDFRAHEAMLRHPALLAVTRRPFPSGSLDASGGECMLWEELHPIADRVIESIGAAVTRASNEPIDAKNATRNGLEDFIPIEDADEEDPYAEDQVRRFVRSSASELVHAQSDEVVDKVDVMSQLGLDTLPEEDVSDPVDVPPPDTPSGPNHNVVAFSAFLRAYEGGTGVDRLYLDNSFCHPDFDFPPPSEGVARAVEIVRRHPDHIIIIAIDSLGKERFLADLATAVNERICIPADRLEAMALLGDPAVTEALESDVFTSDKRHARIRLMSRHAVKQSLLRKWNDKALRNRQEWIRTQNKAVQAELDADVTSADTNATQVSMEEAISVRIPMSTAAWDQCSPVVAIFPSGWACIRTPYDGEHTYFVPYSLHSSFKEMARFVSAVAPRLIIPTSDVSTSAMNRLRTMSRPMLSASPGKGLCTIDPRLLTCAADARRRWRGSLIGNAVSERVTSPNASGIMVHRWAGILPLVPAKPVHNLPIRSHTMVASVADLSHLKPAGQPRLSKIEFRKKPAASAKLPCEPVESLQAVTAAAEPFHNAPAITSPSLTRSASDPLPARSTQESGSLDAHLLVDVFFLENHVTPLPTVDQSALPEAVPDTHAQLCGSKRHRDSIPADCCAIAASVERTFSRVDAGTTMVEIKTEVSVSLKHSSRILPWDIRVTAPDRVVDAAPAIVCMPLVPDPDPDSSRVENPCMSSMRRPAATPATKLLSLLADEED